MCFLSSSSYLSSFFSETCKACCCFTCINLQPPSWAGRVSYPPRETGVCFPMEYSHLLSLFFSSESSSKGREHSHMEPGRSRRGELENSEDGEIHPGQRMSWARGMVVALTALERWGIGLFFVFRGRIKTKMWNISPWGWCWLFRVFMKMSPMEEAFGGLTNEFVPLEVFRMRLDFILASMWRMYIALRKDQSGPVRSGEFRCLCIWSVHIYWWGSYFVSAEFISSPRSWILPCAFLVDVF